MKIKLSRKQWEQIGKTAGWELPEDFESIRNQRFYEEGVRNAPDWQKTPSGYIQTPKKLDYNPIETISNPSTGKMHRCRVCWSDTPAGAKDNGFIPVLEPIVHAEDCPHKHLTGIKS